MAKKFLTPLGLVGLTSDPATGSEGQLYFNTTDDVVRVYANGEWTELSGAGGESASVYYQTEAPEGAPLGALWVDSDSTGTGGTGGGTSGTSLLYWTEDNNGNLLPDLDNIYSVGSSAYRVKDLYLGASSLYLQNPANASANISLSVDSSGNLKINNSKIITESNANNNLNLTNYATLEYARSASAAAVNYLVNGAPNALNTLNELSTALNNDENFATTVTNALSSKLSIQSASTTYQLKDLITSISENHNAQDNETIFVNSASSSINVTLPSSPTTGSKIKILDVSANAQNNNITVLGNGNNIGGASAYTINAPDSSVEVMYINAIKGWNVLNEYISLTKPGAPTAVSALDVGTGRAYNNGAANVTFTPSVSGDSATSFTVVSTPGSYTAIGASSPITVTGLQSNIGYTFAVTATNSAGSSAPSSSSSLITATTVPQAPTINSVTGKSAKVDVDFTNGETGGKSISTFTVTRSSGGTTTGASSPISVTSLTGGTSYTFTMTATNANGTSISSNTSNSATPFSISGGITQTYNAGGIDYRSHTFTSLGDLTISGTATGVDYLIVAAGGGGGAKYGGGGGGAGGMRSFTSQTLTAGTYTATIGSGGGGGVANSKGGTGNNSVFNSQTSNGGGGGGSTEIGNLSQTGNGGGSGGGAASAGNGGGTSGGVGTAGQGNNGGSSVGTGAGNGNGGGGGGAGAVGQNSQNADDGANGGNGSTNSYRDGTNITYAGGGGGGGRGGDAGSGGAGGGGAGNATNGTANTGGGGGARAGTEQSTAASGGSGIIVIRYAI
jgi:hypothetical protein